VDLHDLVPKKKGLREDAQEPPAQREAWGKNPKK
jgi:hypothetical protein